MISQIKNSLAKAFSRKKTGAGKADSGVTADSDSISVHSDVSVADSAIEYLSTPAVRTADWFVHSFVESSCPWGKRCMQVVMCLFVYIYIP